MILTLSALYGLAQACAPAVAPETLLAVARAESGFDPNVVAANGTPRRVYHPGSAGAAAALAGQLIAAGRNLDLGLGQINSRNLRRLGLSLADAFQPCRNLTASARVLQDAYRRAAPRPGDEQRGLRAALSIYNTGDATRGLRNGYVARITTAAATVVPAIQIAAGSATPEDPGLAAPPDPPPPPAAWDVFAQRASRAVSVF